MKHPTRDVELLDFLSEDPEVVHAYERLLSGIELASRTRPHRILVVTSSQPGEGKTTVLGGLALSLALAGRKVLLIDGDLRRPSLHKLFGMDDRPGWSDLVTGRDEVEKVIQRRDAGLPASIGVIPAGSAARDALHQLGSGVIRDALAKVSSGFEHVLIDTPPVLAADDALFLSAAADGVVFVVGTGAVRRDQVTRARRRLEQAGGHIVGVAMTSFESRLHGAGSHPYGGYGGRSAGR